MRQVSFGGMMAGLLGGISEPSLYGVLLRFRKSYMRLLPGCFAGGVVMGLFDVKANAFVFTSLLTVPAMDPMGGYAIGIAVAFFTSFFLVVFFDYRTKEEQTTMRAENAGIPLLIPGERFNATIVRYLKFARFFNEQFPGFETDIHGLVKQTVNDKAEYFVDCVR